MKTRVFESTIDKVTAFLKNNNGKVIQIPNKAVSYHRAYRLLEFNVLELAPEEGNYCYRVINIPDRSVIRKALIAAKMSREEREVFYAEINKEDIVSQIIKNEPELEINLWGDSMTDEPLTQDDVERRAIKTLAASPNFDYKITRTPKNLKEEVVL